MDLTSLRACPKCVPLFTSVVCDDPKCRNFDGKNATSNTRVGEWGAPTNILLLARDGDKCTKAAMRYKLERFKDKWCGAELLVGMKPFVCNRTAGHGHVHVCRNTTTRDAVAYWHAKRG